MAKKGHIPWNKGKTNIYSKETLEKMASQIKYKGGYKYQLAETHSCKIDICPVTNIQTEYIELTDMGRLTIKEGYCWDGASGPAIDTKRIMRGSLVHDALYQLLREGFLPPEDRVGADMELRKIILEDGMSWMRAWYCYRVVRRLAGYAAKPEYQKEILIAP